jgi:hypothetical protein
MHSLVTDTLTTLFSKALASCSQEYLQTVQSGAKRGHIRSQVMLTTLITSRVSTFRPNVQYSKPRYITHNLYILRVPPPHGHVDHAFHTHYPHHPLGRACACGCTPSTCHALGHPTRWHSQEVVDLSLLYNQQARIVRSKSHPRGSGSRHTYVLFYPSCSKLHSATLDCLTPQPSLSSWRCY